LEVVIVFKGISPHLLAVLQAFLVTFLWSTSWVLIKFGLGEQQIPALTFAGLRYTLAFLCLLPFVLRQPANLTPLRHLRPRDIVRLIALGLLFYTIAQGAQFVSLSYLPAATLNLMLGFSAVIVAGLGMLLLRESPTRAQWGGLLLYVVGALIYFLPVVFTQGEFIGFAVAVLCLLANSVSTVLSRALNRDHLLPPVTITTVTMGLGGITLLVIGLITQGLPPLSLISIVSIIWLSVVNTAFAFTLWNKTLKILSALEMSIINSTMMIFIPLLAWVFLDEALTWKAILGLALAGLGILIVQLRGLPVTFIRRKTRVEA
jgi:drug/metabolite transporter (DMT)-like permease